MVVRFAWMEQSECNPGKRRLFSGSLYGGEGYMEEYPIARLYRDVRVHTIYAGTSEVMKLIIARKLGL
ncbi:acyl-CoA dehydrogenase family protein [Desulfosporosinus lacus]|uniref:acyl-CoA dehydrogenase family protein n=1 Tax=Desulfosporosinus lacus TaxID=329936 RepID=UPI0031F3897F